MMKKIGIIGGLTSASSAESYRLIAEKSKKYLCDHHSAEIFIISINPTKIISAMQIGNWTQVVADLVKIAHDLEELGAELVVIPCNSVHKIAGKVQEQLSVPLINIIDSVGEQSRKNHYTKLGLLGTLFTTESGFYQNHLKKYYQIETIIPMKSEREILHKIIFSELCKDKFKPETKKFVQELCIKMHNQMQCDAVILGCTELPLLLGKSDLIVPLIDTIDAQAEHVVVISNSAIKNDSLKFLRNLE